MWACNVCGRLKMNLNYAQKKNPFKSQMVVGLACSEVLVYNMWAVELNGCQTCHQLSERYTGPCLNAPHNITKWHWWPANIV